MNSGKGAALLAACLLNPTIAMGQIHDVQGVVEVDGRQVENVVVYVERDSGGTPGTVHPDTVIMDQRGLRFLPSVVAGRPGLTVEFLNSDPILHNVFSPGWSGESFDLGTYPSNMSRSHTFSRPGPHVILCHVHPEMVAYVVVVSTPFHAVTGPEGRFRIEGIPAGSHRIEVWRRGSEPVGRRFTVPEVGDLSLTLDLADLEE